MCPSGSRGDDVFQGHTLKFLEVVVNDQRVVQEKGLGQDFELSLLYYYYYNFCIDIIVRLNVKKNYNSV